MKKILLVFNGVGYPAHVVDFAFGIAKTGGSLLHAVFMTPRQAEDTLQYPFPNDLSLTEDKSSIAEDRKTDDEAIKANKLAFQHECTSKNMPFTIDDEPEVTLKDLIEHSKFSDLILADINDDLGEYAITELLSDTHCPVILVQRTTEIPQRVILAYDGSPSSIQAIKLYSYLFSESRNMETVFVQVNPDHKAETRSQEYIQDWLTRHFSRLTLKILEGDPVQQLTKVISDASEKTMMVMGAYAQKGVARLFHHNVSDEVINASKGSLFIYHQ